MKTVVVEAAPSAAHIFYESNVNHMKGEPVLAQLVNTEPALLVKEDILEDSRQAHTDGDEQQCVAGTSTSAGASLCDLHNVKNEPSDMDIGPVVLHHMDIHYKINQLNTSAATEENTILDEGNEVMPSSGVKKKSVEDELRDSSSKQEVQGGEQRKHRRFMCDKCWKVYKYKRCLRNHTKREHATDTLKCTQCNKEFKRKAYLLLHVRNAHSDEQYECAICKRQCKSRAALRIHYSYFHRNRFAAMEYGAANCFTEPPHTEVTMMTGGVEDAAPSTAHIFYESNVDLTKGEPVLAQLVKSEPALLVKEDILEDNSQAHIDGDEQQCVEGVSTSAVASLCDLLNVKHEPSDMEIGPFLLQHMDIHYKINQPNTSAATEENTILHEGNEVMSSSRVKKESVEDELRDSLYMQEVQGSEELKLQPYSCHKCLFKTYKSEQALRNHIKREHATETHKCTRCDKKFNCKLNLLRHVRCEHSEEQYKCDFCKEQCKSWGDLWHHLSYFHPKRSAASHKQQGNVFRSSPAIFCSVGEAADSASQRNIITIKQEAEDPDLDIGPTVLQHMDSYYSNNQIKVEQLKVENAPLTNE